MLTSIRKFLAAMDVPADSAYSTVVYPTRGVPVLVHDGLGIAQERPWYQLPATELQQDQLDSLDIQPIDDDLIERLSQLEDGDSGFSFTDAFGDLVSSITDSVSSLGAVPIDRAPQFPARSAVSGLSIFDSIDNGLFTSGYETSSVNPANGLPMLDSCIDVAGNPFGMG